jgi:hypothetical protein
MQLTRSQQTRFWRDWTKAAVKNFPRPQWSSAQIENERHALLRRAGFDSLTEVDPRAGFDRVLAELRAMQDDVPGAQETLDPTIGESRRLRHVIRAELLPCLALYMVPIPPRTPMQAAETYLTEVVSGLVRWTKLDRPTRPPTLDDLDAHPIYAHSGPCHSLRESPSQLHQAIMTLTARLHAKRRVAGDTIHDMLTKAGLPCACRACQAARKAAAATTTQFPVPSLPIQPTAPAVPPPVEAGDNNSDPF